MTRKYILLSIIITFFLYFLLSGTVGTKGFIRNSVLKRELQAIKKQEEMMEIDVQTLKNRRDSATSVDELRDTAYRLGYLAEGETVYYFDEPDTQTTIDLDFETEKMTVQRPGFSGLSNGIILLLAFGTSQIVAVTVVLVTIRKKGKHDSDYTI